MNKESIPAELKELPQWVLWDYFKVPRTIDDNFASTTDPKTWSTFDEVKVNERIGFVFTADDPYIGIDIDNCTTEGGEFAPGVFALLMAFQSYAEISPSGRGIHIIIRGKLPGKGVRRKNIEVYDQGRYFTMTGNTLPGFGEIKERQEQLEQLLSEIQNGS